MFKKFMHTSIKLTRVEGGEVGASVCLSLFVFARLRPRLSLWTGLAPFSSGALLLILLLLEALKTLDAAKLQKKTVRVMVETFMIEGPQCF